MSKVNKIAILIDGGFFKQRFKFLNGRPATKTDIEALINSILQKVDAKSGESSIDILYRTYYYDCLPFGKVVKSVEGKVVDYSTSKIFTQQTQFIDSLKDIDQFALRLGELGFSGWKLNASKKPGAPKYLPDFKQKSVDMKMGLDMAWMASKSNVGKIVIVGGDTDFISPIKFVRREGILVYLWPMKNFVPRSLIEHCDFLLDD